MQTTYSVIKLAGGQSGHVGQRMSPQGCCCVSTHNKSCHRPWLSFLSTGPVLLRHAGNHPRCRACRQLTQRVGLIELDYAVPFIYSPCRVNAALAGVSACGGTGRVAAERFFWSLLILTTKHGLGVVRFSFAVVWQCPGDEKNGVTIKRGMVRTYRRSSCTG